MIFLLLVVLIAIAAWLWFSVQEANYNDNQEWYSQQVETMRVSNWVVAYFRDNREKIVGLSEERVRQRCDSECAFNWSLRRKHEWYEEMKEWIDSHRR